MHRIKQQIPIRQESGQSDSDHPMDGWLCKKEEKKRKTKKKTQDYLHYRVTIQQTNPLLVQVPGTAIYQPT